MTAIDNETVKRVMDELRQAVNKARDAWDDPAIDAAFAAARAALSTDPTEARETVGCEDDGPKRRWTIAIDVGGDERDDVLSLLGEFVEKIQGGENYCVHGGPSRGGSYRVTERPEVTHDSYFAAIKARKARRVSTPNTQPSGGPKDGAK